MPEATPGQTPQTPEEGQVAPATSTPQEEGQVTQTAEGQQGQPQEGAEPVDLSKIPLDQLGQEQIAELQKGYLRQSDYTTKTQELSDEKKKLGSPEHFEALLQNPEFIQWAASKSQTQPQQQTSEEVEEKLANMSEQERIDYYVQKSLQPIAQSYWQDKQATQDERLTAKYGEAIYTPHIPKITQMQQVIAKTPNLYREEAFKILDYEAYGKRCLETGRQEGLKGIQTRQQANMVQGEGSPSTQREIFRGKDALTRSWERAEQEGKKVYPL